MWGESLHTYLYLVAPVSFAENLELRREVAVGLGPDGREPMKAVKAGRGI